MAIKYKITASNDNAVNLDFVELTQVCTAYRRETGKFMLENDGARLRHRDPRTIANFNWFVKFEYSCLKEAREDQRRKMREILQVQST